MPSSAIHVLWPCRRPWGVSPSLTGSQQASGASPAGCPQLAPAIERVRRRVGQVPRAVTTDRGYGQAAVERDLHAAGVRTVAIPRQATTSAARRAVEHGRGFRKLVKWRTGC